MKYKLKDLIDTIYACSFKEGKKFKEKILELLEKDKERAEVSLEGIDAIGSPFLYTGLANINIIKYVKFVDGDEEQMLEIENMQEFYYSKAKIDKEMKLFERMQKQL